jgi:hypothetical protein
MLVHHINLVVALRTSFGSYENAIFDVSIEVYNRFMATFPEFTKKYGVGVPYASVPQDVFQSYQGQLPAPLLEEWAAVGWCSYGNGFLWLVNPAEYTDVLSGWLEPSDQALVFGRTAFGNLLVWRNNEMQYLYTQYARIQTLTKNINFFFEFSMCDKDFLDKVLEQKLFYQAVKKLGELKPNECYGFEPILALGGSETIETTTKVSLHEYLSLLSQVATA